MTGRDVEYFPRLAALGAKDAYVQRARAVLTMASLALAGSVVVCALAFEATMDRLAAEPALRAQPWDLTVDTDGMTPERVDRLLASPELPQALTAMAAARFAWFDLALLNPAWVRQEVGSVPLFNLILPAFGGTAAWAWAARLRWPGRPGGFALFVWWRWVRDETRSPAADGLDPLDSVST